MHRLSGEVGLASFILRFFTPVGFPFNDATEKEFTAEMEALGACNVERFEQQGDIGVRRQGYLITFEQTGPFIDVKARQQRVCDIGNDLLFEQYGPVEVKEEGIRPVRPAPIESSHLPPSLVGDRIRAGFLPLNWSPID